MQEGSGLADRTEELHLFLDGVLDGLVAGSQQLAGVIALALLVLALFDVLAGRRGESQLALGVDIDLGNAQGDRLANHLGRDAGAALPAGRSYGGTGGSTLALAEYLGKVMDQPPGLFSMNFPLKNKKACVPGGTQAVKARLGKDGGV